MKFRKIPALLLAVLLTLWTAGIAGAQSAYSTAFTTSITYANVGSGTANITITYYNENNGTGIAVPMAQLAKGASSSVFVGNVTASNFPATFKGAAVLSSDQPVVATLVQIPASTSPVKNRPLSNGFQAGSSRVLLASVLKSAFSSFTTVFSVQNAGSAAANFNVTLNPTTGSSIVIPVTGLPVGASKYFDLNTLTQVPAGFNGSAVIEGTGVSLVATAMELQNNGNSVSAFEGVSGGANTVYMPSALCKFLVNGQPTNTSYAIQNVGTTDTAVTVTFNNGKVVNFPTVGAGKKVSVQGCVEGISGVTPNPAGYSGSATIKAGTSGQIVVLGKVSGAGISSAFLGEATGSPKLSLAYVRWTEADWLTGKKQRTFIAIQNVGGALAANTVKVHYYGRDGALVGTYTIPTAIAAGGKVSVNPFQLGAVAAEFGSYPGGQFGGGAQIEGPAGSQLVAVARVVSYVNATTQPGEDYNGVAIQ